DWKGELPGRAVLIDQTLLPTKLEYLELATAEQMWEAIKVLRVRGAPAIGIAAAYGLVLGVQEFRGDDGAQFAAEVARVDQYLRTARPTAVNLCWALDRMRRRHADEAKRSVAEQKRALLQEARAIQEEDKAICRAIGRHGARLVTDGTVALTHCNAGGLATADYGTALAVFFAAHEQGRRFPAFAGGARPLPRGARRPPREADPAGHPAAPPLHH